LAKRGGLAVQVLFKSVAGFTAVRQMAPLPSGINCCYGQWRNSNHLVLISILFLIYFLLVYAGVFYFGLLAVGHFVNM